MGGGSGIAQLAARDWRGPRMRRTCASTAAPPSPPRPKRKTSPRRQRRLEGPRRSRRRGRSERSSLPYGDLRCASAIRSVRVFIGPVPGWTGPVLAADPRSPRPRPAGRRQGLFGREAKRDRRALRPAASRTRRRCSRAALRTPPTTVHHAKRIKHTVGEQGIAKPAATRNAGDDDCMAPKAENQPVRSRSPARASDDAAVVQADSP